MNEIDFLKEEEKRNEFLEIDYKFLWKLAYLEIDSYKTQCKWAHIKLEYN